MLAHTEKSQKWRAHHYVRVQLLPTVPVNANDATPSVSVSVSVSVAVAVPRRVELFVCLRACSSFHFRGHLHVLLLPRCCNNGKWHIKIFSISREVQKPLRKFCTYSKITEVALLHCPLSPCFILLQLSPRVVIRIVSAGR